MKILAFSQSGTMNGGANRSFLMVLENLKTKYGHEIKVVTPGYGVLNDELHKRGIETVVTPYNEISGVSSLSLINIYRWLRFHWYCLQDKKSAAKLVKDLQKESFDLVYINDTDVYFGVFVAQLLNVPYVWHFRSYVDPKGHFVFGARGIYGRSARIIAISHGMEKTLLENPLMPHEKITVIHNGIPLSENAMLSARARADGLHMVQCGRISEEKGHRDAINALAILKNEGKQDIYLHIVGAALDGKGGAYLGSLKELITKYGLDSQVIFEGTINDMPSFRVNMHVELMCSVSEPFGRVTLEGMRSGLTVIGSNTGGTPEIITDGQTGLLYKQGDPSDLASKIRAVYENEEYAQKLASNAVEFSATHFTPEQNVAAIEQTLCDALK